MTATTSDKAELTERHEALSGRLAELRAQAADLLADIAAAETDFLDCVETGADDPHLLSERVEHRKRELATCRRAHDHLSTLLAGVASQLAEIQAAEQLDHDLALHKQTLVELAERQAELLPAYAATVERTVAAARDLHTMAQRLRTGAEGAHTRAESLRGRCAALCRSDDVPDVGADIAAPMNAALRGQEDLRRLMLLTIQDRHDVAGVAEMLGRTAAAQIRRSP